MFHARLPSPRSLARRATLAVAGASLVTSAVIAAPTGAASAFHGGWGIVRPTSATTAAACTDGFHGRASDGRPVVITAGHCGPRGAIWLAEKDWRRIGKTTKRQFRTDGSGNDWAIIRSNGNYALTATVVDAGKVKQVARLGAPKAGMTVCTTGRTSGTRCGSITRVKANGIVVTDILSKHGDSGSPLFRRIPGTNKVAALGILSYGDESTYSAYQRLSEVLKATGVRLRTA